MMSEADIFLVEDTQQSNYGKEARKSWKHRPPILSSFQTFYSSQDTEDSGTSTKKRKKKKSTLETSDDFCVVPETQLTDESERDNFVPKKKKTKMKHRFNHGSDDEGWNPLTPQKSSKLSRKKALENGGAVGGEFETPSTSQKSSKLFRKKALENGGAVGGEFETPSTSQKSSKLFRKKALENRGDVGGEFETPSTSQKSSKLFRKKALENRGDVGGEFETPSTSQKSSKLFRKKALENRGDVGGEFGTTSTSKKSSKLPHKKALENGGAVGGEFETPSTSQKSSKLFRKKTLENGGAVGDEFVTPSTSKKSSKLFRKKALENGGAVGDEFVTPSTSKKSSKLFHKKALENGGAVGGEFGTTSTSKKSSKLSHKKALENEDDVGGEFGIPSTSKKSSKLYRKKALENENDVGDGFGTPSTSKKSSKLSHKKTLETGGAVGDVFGAPSTSQKSSKLSHKKTLENEDDVGDAFGTLSTSKISSKLSHKKALENEGDVGDEFGTLSTSKKSSKLSHKKALENEGDVGDEFGTLSTSQKSSKLSHKKALENEGDVGDVFGTPSTSQKSSKLSHKKALENEGDVGGEFGTTSTSKKSSKLSHKKALENGGDVGDVFETPSTSKKSSKLSQKEDLENGSVIDRSSHKKKKRKQRGNVRGPAKENAEAASSQREDQMDLDQTIDTQVDLFASSPLSFSEGPPVDLLTRDGQEGSHCPTAEDSDATQIDLETEGTSGGDREQKQYRSPSKSPISEVNTKLDQSQTGRRLRSSRPSETSVEEEEEEEDVYALEKEQLENARKELEEYIPRAKTLSDSAIRQLATRDLSRFKELKKKGLAVKFGVFSQAENKLLTQNVEAFLEESGIETAEKLLFTHRFPEEQAEIKRLKCRYSFCERISQGIARPWRLVYYRARKMFDPQNYNGRYTKKELKKLFKYHAMYGNNWKKISELMNRSSHSIALKYAQLAEDSNIGPWTEEETSRLLQTMRDILKTRVKGLDSALENRDTQGALVLQRENLYKNIGWMKVAAQVETRGWRQCKKKWMSILTKKMMGKSPFRGLSNLKFKIDLIERLYELNVADINEIDWERIADIVGNAPPDYIKDRYYQLKTLCVPFWYEKTFPEIIDYLFEETLPNFKETFEKLSQKQTSVQEETRCKRTFRFNDIFQDILEDELLNSEDESSDGEAAGPSQADD
ncbi:transcription termination factor 1 [Erythrolamprus reginae]|uniref:transcription termination factor 1 n=1 Tax=Erythrolamprus reginae TaxID=121349 RepID=UPI00396C8D81